MALLCHVLDSESALFSPKPPNLDVLFFRRYIYASGFEQGIVFEAGWVNKVDASDLPATMLLNHSLSVTDFATRRASTSYDEIET